MGHWESNTAMKCITREEFGNLTKMEEHEQPTSSKVALTNSKLKF